MPFAAIYVPDFSVEALVRTAPEWRGPALAVVDGTPPLRLVVGANEPARQCGVELGMTAVQAEERLNCVVGGQLRRRSAAQEQAAHAALLDAAHAFSPRIEDTAADTVLLDVAGLERLFGPPAALARELARRVAMVGMETHVAVAANPDAALHAARGFPGVTVIAPGQEAARLGTLPLDVLAAPGEMLETLDRWGVRTLRALAVLPEVAVAERLGEEGVRLQKLARGDSLRPLCVAEPPLRFEEAVELEYPVALLEPLAFLLNRMLEQLCARLAARALAAQELRLRLELDQLEDPENPPQRHRDTENVSSFAFRVSRGPEQHETRNPPQRYRDTENFNANRGFTQIHADQIENQESQNENSSASQRPCSEVPLEDPEIPLHRNTENVSSFAFRVSRGPEQHETRNGKRETLFTRAIKLPVPMLDARIFLKLLQLDLQAHPPGAPVVKIWLEAEPAEPRRAQGGLFVPATPEAEKLELTLARIEAVVRPCGPGSSTRAGRVGDPPPHNLAVRVGSPEVLDTHRPDAFRMRKFNPGAVKPQGPSTRAPNSGALAQDDNLDAAVVQSPIANRQSPMTAMRLFRPPLEVAVELKEGRPVKLRTDDVRITTSGSKSSIVNRQSSILEVLWAAGPWRISGDWWEEQAWAHEEWDVAIKNEAGIALYRIYRDATAGGWFVEAEYD